MVLKNFANNNKKLVVIDLINLKPTVNQTN